MARRTRSRPPGSVDARPRPVRAAALAARRAPPPPWRRRRRRASGRRDRARQGAAEPDLLDAHDPVAVELQLRRRAGGRHVPPAERPARHAVQGQRPLEHDPAHGRADREHARSGDEPLQRHRRHPDAALPDAVEGWQPFTWGAGPVVSMPTATTAAMQTGSWAAGPTFVALDDARPWVIGAVVNNVWTFSDAGSDTKMNQFLLQPFVNFNFGKGWAISTVPVITANWDAESGQKWTVPVGAGISRTVVFSGRPMTLAVHYYHNVVHPTPRPRTRCGSWSSCSSRNGEAGPGSSSCDHRVRHAVREEVAVGCAQEATSDGLSDAVSSDHVRPTGPRLHRVEPGGHGPPGQDARGRRGVAEQEVPGADLRVGLGGGAGARLSDHPGTSAGGALRRRGAPRQPGALRAVPPADGGKGPRRHGLRGRPHPAGGDRHGRVDAA